MKVRPPATKQELMQRAESLAGITIQQLANKTDSAIPESTTHAKAGLAYY